MDDLESPLEQTVAGRLVGVAGRADLAGVAVWFAYRPVGGDATTVETTSDADGHFAFALPPGRLESARVGAHIEGASPVDLEPNGERLEPGDLVLLVDDALPSHLRYAG